MRASCKSSWQTTSDDKWLKFKDAAAQQFNEKEKHPDIQQMIGVEQVIATRTLQRWLFVDNKMPQPSLTEIHVLVVVPEQENQLQAQNVHDLVRLREANISESRFAVLMDEMLDEKLDEKLALLYHKTAKSYSKSTLGHREIARLEKDELFFDFAPVKDGETFWTEKIQIQSDAITNEADFVAFVTPFFSSILESCGLVFVNSGRYPWLPQSPNLKKNKYLKPSGFATHRGMYHAKPELEGQVRRPGDFFRFGVAEEELFDCLILFESKLRISDAAFGQVVQYLQNLCPEDSAYAILFDRQSFWLIKSYKTVVCSVQKAKWITKGSKSLFQNFISKNTSPWVAYLTNACIALSVDVVEGDAENTGLTIRLVSREYIETIEGWALLMYPVGKTLPRPETREEVRSLFQLLWQLHAKNLVHGDPRVPNVILTEEKALWIDLAELCEACPNLKRRDAEMLTRSIRRLPFRYSLSLALVHSLDSYYQCATQENLDHLAEVVWESVLSAAG